MSKIVKFMSVVVMSAGFSAVATIPAHALSVIAPAYAGQTDTQGSTYTNPPVAFTGGAGDTSNQSGSTLSAGEIQHVTWCAQNYVSYHPSDNTYETRQGARVACRSPY